MVVRFFRNDLEFDSTPKMAKNDDKGGNMTLFDWTTRVWNSIN